MTDFSKKYLPALLLLPLLLAAAPVDKHLIEKDTAAWLQASAASKDHAMTAAMVVFIKKGLWKGQSKGPKEMAAKKLALIACVDQSAAAIKKQGGKPRPVAEAIFACGQLKGFIRKTK